MPNSATLVQALGAAFCAILCALSGMGGGGMMIGARTAAWAKSGGVPFLRLTPNGSTPPFNTGRVMTADTIVEFKVRIHDVLGSWGTILGNVRGNVNTGINIRQSNNTSTIFWYCAGTNGYNIDATDWVDYHVEVYNVVYNGVVDRNSPYMHPEQITATGTIRVGGAPSYAQTCVTDWQYVKIWENGELVVHYIPDKSGTFLDLVSGELVTKAGSFDVAYMEEAV